MKKTEGDEDKCSLQRFRATEVCPADWVRERERDRDRHTYIDKTGRVDYRCIAGAWAQTDRQIVIFRHACAHSTLADFFTVYLLSFFLK